MGSRQLYDQYAQSSQPIGNSQYGNMAQPRSATPSLTTEQVHRILEGLNDYIKQLKDLDCVGYIEQLQKVQCVDWIQWMAGDSDRPRIDQMVLELQRRCAYAEQTIHTLQRSLDQAARDRKRMEARIEKVERALQTVQSGERLITNTPTRARASQPSMSRSQSVDAWAPSQVSRHEVSSGFNRLGTSSPRETQHASLSMTKDTSWRSFVDAYNQLPSSGFEGIEARKRFVAAHGIVGISCINTEERMQNGAAPIFAQQESALQATLWASVHDRGYFVVPCSGMEYHGSVHRAGGLGEVFDSNFSTGTNYHSITVESPALFRRAGNRWDCIKKGKLYLR